MSIFDNEDFLPGVITSIEADYGYDYDTSQFGTTDSVVIIGTAFNGPVGKPIPVYSPEHAKYVFGDVYDPATKREADLVAGIIDAWQKGCRTIYGVRVSGKEIYKDFALNGSKDYKLRVAGIYPSNKNKDVYMMFDNTEGALTLKIYKPALRATINEKMQGMVENEESILVNTFHLSSDYGFTLDSSLAEVIKVVNEYQYNNVLRLSIVNKDGMDVTITDAAAKSLTLGAMFPGVYFIGRNKTAPECEVVTELKYILVGDKVYEKLVLNTDVSTPYPIYGENEIDFAEKFRNVSISVDTDYSFLEVPGAVDIVFLKDNIDYEEVNISKFELYKRLGSGFVITAMIESESGSFGTKVKTKETPVSNPNRIMPINDGIYSVLENLQADYRVLMTGNADDKIADPIPKPSDFKAAKALNIQVLGEQIIATPKIDKDDITEPKTYQFVIKKTFDATPEEIKSSLFQDAIAKRIAFASDVAAIHDLTLPEGALFMTTAPVALYKVIDGKLTPSFDKGLYLVGNRLIECTKDKTFIEHTKDTLTVDPDKKDFVMVECTGNIFVYKFDSTGSTLSPVGDLDTVLSSDVNKVAVNVQSEYLSVNEIVIMSEILDILTLEELVEILNNNSLLNRMFEFSLTKEGVKNKDEYVATFMTGDVMMATASVDKSIGYDFNKYIPYKTTDNFARQLAQHCTYTSLKTATTHGIIGCSKLLVVSLDSIAKRVDELMNLELDLYAKKPNGRNMLDRNNLPYPIGNAISVVFNQDIVNIDGYNYISNGAAGYAGMVSVLPLDQSSTNQPISNCNPAFDLTNYQLSKLTQKGFVTVKQSYTRGYVVTDGITMAPPNSPFRRLSVTRIINYVEELIRAAAEPYIGKQNSIANRNSIQTAIKSQLEKIKGTLIEAYEFNLLVDPRTLKFSHIYIDYAVVPIYEIREIRNRISVKEQL